MKLPISILFSIVFTIVSCFIMFHIKFKVQYLNRDMAEIKKQIDIEHESIRVLKAEWAYLNKPQRLRHMVSKYLPNVKPITLAQIGIINKPQNDDLTILFDEIDPGEKELNNINQIKYMPSQ